MNQVLDETQNYDFSIEEKVLQFCSEAKSIIEICDYLGFMDRRTVRKIINPLLELGRLAMTVPDNQTAGIKSILRLNRGIYLYYKVECLWKTMPMKNVIENAVEMA